MALVLLRGTASVLTPAMEEPGKEVATEEVPGPDDGAVYCRELGSSIVVEPTIKSS